MRLRLLKESNIGSGLAFAIDTVFVGITSVITFTTVFVIRLVISNTHHDTIYIRAAISILIAFRAFFTGFSTKTINTCFPGIFSVAGVSTGAAVI